MAAHRYWRIRSTATYGGTGGTHLACSTLKMRNTLGGTDRALGATATASSTFSGAFLPSNAFDGNDVTFWTTASVSPPAGGHWLAVDFGLGVAWDIIEIVFVSRSSGSTEDPKDIQVEYSDDGVTWTTSWSVSSIPAWGRQEERWFNSTGAYSPSPGLRDTQLGVKAVATINTTERNTQLFTLTAINFPTVREQITQVEALVSAKSATPLRNTQTYALVAIRVGSEERTLRAWTFTQDDHDFYVLQLGDVTYLYDQLSTQWCQWVSPDATYWRGADGCDWQGINVCCDPDTGKIFQIDPNNRLDYATTPIVSQVFGGMTERFRNFTPCYMAEVAISQARPPAGIDASTVGIRIRTYDTLNWIDHGLVSGQPSGTMTTARFYGLGLMRSPGVLFEITDYGYARRLDGLNIEMGGTPDGQ